MEIADVAAKGGGVPAVKRAIALLELVSASPEGLSLAELTNRLRLPKSSIHGICATLVQGGLLQRTGSGSYRLGVHIVDLAHGYLSGSNATVRFMEAWEALGAPPEETVVLSVLDGANVVYVACRNGSHGLTFNYRIGLRLPATCTASGKALLSTLPDQTLDGLFGNQPLSQLTTKSLPDLASLRSDLALTRERGYAVDNEETREGMCCIGAPVFDSPNGAATAAIAISMLKVEYATAKKDQAVATLSALARDLTNRLGGFR